MSLFKLASQSETPFFKTVPKRCMLISQGRPAGVQLVGPRPLHPARVSLRCRCLHAATLLRPRAAAARALLTHVSVRCSLAVQSPSRVGSLRPHGLSPARLLCPWDSPGKSPGMGCHALLQGVFPTQGSNPCLLRLLHQQVDSLVLEPPGKPVITMTQNCKLEREK